MARSNIKINTRTNYAPIFLHYIKAVNIKLQKLISDFSFRFWNLF